MLIDLIAYAYFWCCAKTLFKPPNLIKNRKSRTAYPKKSLRDDNIKIKRALSVNIKACSTKLKLY